MIGQRPGHPIHKAARAAGLAALHAATIGEPDAWIGVAFAGWKDAARQPPMVQPLLAVVASFCHAALRLAGLTAQASAQASVSSRADRELEALLDVAAEAFLVLDVDLRVGRCNRAAAELLGYQPAELLDLPVNDLLISPDDLTATLLDAAGHRRPGERPQLVLHHRDGTPFPAHVRVAPIEHEGEAVRLVLSIQDLSEREALAGQSEVLHQRAVLGEVSAIFAHEVRNPINNISTGIQLVASRLGDQHPLYPALDRVHKECNRLDQLMRDVLLFARPLELKMEPVDLAAMVEMLLQRWRPRLAQAQIRAHTELQAGLPPVPADPRALEQVLVNLLSNAIQAMPAGGTLSVRLWAKPGESGPQIELQIADTGPGIPADQVTRIFDPFFTTRKEGTGLGLAISRRIVAAHKGSIQAESFPGAGTLFTIRLPAGVPISHRKDR
jgi:PAS domain S-box-containing protein